MHTAMAPTVSEPVVSISQQIFLPGDRFQGTYVWWVLIMLRNRAKF